MIYRFLFNRKMDETFSNNVTRANSENEERISKEIVRNISLKREGRSTFVTFNDFFTKDPLDNSIPICTLRESISSEPILDSVSSDPIPESVSSDPIPESIGSDPIPEPVSPDPIPDSPVSERKFINIPAHGSERKDTGHNKGTTIETNKKPITHESSIERKVPLKNPAHATREDTFFREDTDVECGLENIDVLQTADGRHIWTKFGKEVSQIDSEEKVIFKQDFSALVDDVAVLSSNSVFLVESQSKTIRFLKIEAGEPVITIFDILSPDTPENICINTKTREIVITVLMNKGLFCFKRARTSIRRYHYSGKCIDEIIPKNKGKFVFEGSLDMVCNGNGDICIAAVKGLSHFVAVFDQSVNFRFLYDGGKERQNSFRPTSVCADCHNNILSLDSNSNSVHVIDQNGSFLRLISPFSDNAVCPKITALCVLKGDKLLMGQDTGKIRVLHFTAYSELTKL